MIFFPFFRFFLILSIGLWPLGTGREGAPIKETSFDLPAKASDYEFIRIALEQGVQEMTVTPQGPYRVKDAKGRTLRESSSAVPLKIRAMGTGLRVGAENYPEALLTLESPAGQFKVGSRLYRHGITIWREASGRISVINQITIEDYLKGVLPWEANPKWTMEALKAQAIASRTYALFKAIENRDKPFDLSKDVLSQVYGGKTSENSITSLAVDLTKGKVLVYDGKLFPAYFHSTCGGATTHAEYLWDVKPHPALQGVKCDFCRESKHYRWADVFSAADIEARLKKKGVPVSGLLNLSAADNDKSGRARSFVVEHRGGKVKLHSNDFRLWMDPMKLKSTFLDGVQKTSAGYRFAGRGWGHGVGLCQYGMKKQGEMGWPAERILKFYYPGSQVMRLGTVPAPSTQAGLWDQVLEWFE